MNILTDYLIVFFGWLAGTASGFCALGYFILYVHTIHPGFIILAVFFIAVTVAMSRAMQPVLNRI